MYINSNKKWAGVVASVLLAVLVSGVCNAAIYKEQWETSDAGWQVLERDGDAAFATAYGWNAGGEYFEIARDSADAGIFIDKIFADSSADGTLTTDPHYLWQPIQFDFYANAAAIGAKLFAYVKGDADTYGWANELTTISSAGWNPYSIGLSYNAGAGWNRWDGEPMLFSDWANAVANIDEVGILIWYASGSPGQVFGLDNFTIIPEPETWLMLGFALLSVAITFRRQINDACSKVRLDYL